ncbi:MAG TPA: hypothetical protein VHJ54_06835 [Solirubrobacterales bacterium]|jgi:hypothetical protein|nr:hypothetical protein [Solirubrobacterales bacterium]
MNLKRITDRAKELVEKRGGIESLKRDAAELKNIATGKGSLKDKAKAATEAVKKPGSGAEEVGQRVQEAAPDQPPAQVGEQRAERPRATGG